MKYARMIMNFDLRASLKYYLGTFFRRDEESDKEFNVV
jgi:hypothetical protein